MDRAGRHALAWRGDWDGSIGSLGYLMSIN